MADATDLTCREVVELVTDYLEGRLAAGDRERFEQHLEECDGCRSYLQQMRVTLRLVGRLREEALDEPVKAALTETFRSWKRGRDAG